MTSANPLIYLASASPRRSALLGQIGLAHRVRPVHVDEQVLPGELPDKYVERLAELKARTLWDSLEPSEHHPVLGADTAVAVDAHILGKPANESDGLRMLSLLAGRTHQVYTAVALRWASGCEKRLSVSEVTFRALSAAEMQSYWRSGEPADKAGGYGIQGFAALFIERITGSYSGIMGLPLYETGELLASIDWGIDDALAPVAVSVAGEARG